MQGIIATKIMNKKVKTEFKQVRRFVQNNEQIALEKAVQSLGVPANQLQAAHTETTFIFKVVDSATGDQPAPTEKNAKYPFGLFTFERTGSETDLQDAKRAAMQHFNTFEANVKRVESEEDETHFCYTKVRG